MKVTQKIELSQIPTDTTYEGYYWLSDEQEAVFLHNETISIDVFSKVERFVVEAELYSSVNNSSYKIKFIDGAYQVLAYNLNEIDPSNCKEQKYHVRNKDFQTQMLEAWEVEVDGLTLDGFSVLVPAWSAFKGFIPKQ